MHEQIAFDVALIVFNVLYVFYLAKGDYRFNIVNVFVNVIEILLTNVKFTKDILTACSFVSNSNFPSITNQHGSLEAIFTLYKKIVL